MKNDTIPYERYTFNQKTNSYDKISSTFLFKQEYYKIQHNLKPLANYLNGYKLKSTLNEI